VAILLEQECPRLELAEQMVELLLLSWLVNASSEQDGV